MFKELAGEGALSEAQLAKHLGTLRLALPAEHRQLLFEQICPDGAMSRQAFAEMLERYFKCIKDIVMTNALDLESEIVRKVAVGEILEVLEGPTTIEDTGISRVRARALADNKKGWVALKGNKGTCFLQQTMKPAYCVAEATVIEGESGGEAKVGDVLELIRGPITEAALPATRARCKASSGQTGWITVSDPKGQVFAQPGKSRYACVAAIALTDLDNIKAKECKVLRKVEKGEALLLVDGPTDFPDAGVSRIKVQCAKDQKEGWVTLKGNAGKSFVEEASKLYDIAKAVPLESGFQTGSSEVATLSEGDSVEILEGPKEEKSADVVLLEVRSLSNGARGLVTQRGANLKPWSPHYKCVAPTVMHDRLTLDDDVQTLQRLEIGDTLDLVEGPTFEADMGVLRVKGKVRGVTGWVTIAGNQGKPFLECIMT